MVGMLPIRADAAEAEMKTINMKITNTQFIFSMEDTEWLIERNLQYSDIGIETYTSGTWDGQILQLGVNRNNPSYPSYNWVITVEEGADTSFELVIHVGTVTLKGNFNGEVVNYGKIIDGAFSGTVVNWEGGTINGGTFTGNVLNSGGTDNREDKTLNYKIWYYIDLKELEGDFFYIYGEEKPLLTEKDLKRPEGAVEGSFDGWYQSEAGQDRSTSYTKTKMTKINAETKGEIELNGRWRYALHVEGGSVTAPSDDSGKGYYMREQITVTADAAPRGQVFDKWTTTNPYIRFADESSPQTTFTMPASGATVTATYRVSATTDGDDRGTGDGADQGTTDGGDQGTGDGADKDTTDGGDQGTGSEEDKGEVSVNQVIHLAIRGEESYILGKGDSLTLEADVTTNNPQWSDYKLQWSVEGDALALTTSGEDSKSAVFTALKGGRATITVTGEGKSDSVVVEVLERITKMSFGKESYTGYLKHRVDFSKELVKVPASAEERITWSVSDKRLASVDQKGVVTMKKAGEVTLTAATWHGVLAQTKIKIEAGNPATKLTIRQQQGDTISTPINKLTLGDLGSTAQLLVSVDKVKGKADPKDHTETFTWTSSKPEVVKVEAQGEKGEKAVLTAAGTGKAKITVQAASGKKAVITVTADAHLNAIRVVEENGREEAATVPLKKLALTAIKDPQVNMDKLYWSIKDSKERKLASVNNKGVVTIKTKAVTEPTTVTVTVSTKYSKSSGKTDIFDEFVITIHPSKITGLSGITGSSALKAGEEAVYTAGILGQGSAEEITWSSSNPKVLTIDSAGKATALKAGKATLKATVTVVDEKGRDKTVTKSLPVRVTWPTTGLSMKKEVITVKEGKTSVSFTAVKSPRGAVGEITYSLVGESKGAVIKNPAKGRVTLPKTLKAGEVITVQATVDGHTCEGKILVVNKKTNKISLNHPDLVRKNVITVSQGDVFNLYAKPEYTENETLTYSVNKEGVVAVDDQGNVYALHPGTAKVTVQTTSGAKKTVTVKVEFADIEKKQK